MTTSQATISTQPVLETDTACHELSEHRDQTRRIVASVLGERVYLFFASELGMSPHAHLGGWFSTTLSSVVKERQPDAYFGPAAAIAICDSAVDPLPHDSACLYFDSLVAHEAAHIVDWGLKIYQDSQSNDAELVKTDPDSWPSNQPMQGWPASKPGPKWAGHGLSFIRTLLHVSHRLQARGRWVVLDAAFPHKTYGLSPLNEYKQALGDEPSKNDWRPFAEILASPPPDEFMELWGRDVASSLQLNGNERPNQ